MTRGILLMATTHPSYGRMAANMANTIKAAAPDTNIAVLADDIALKHLSGEELGLFTKIIKVNPQQGVGGAMSLRLNMPKLSPFKETLSIDVDALWLPKSNPEDAFSLLENTDFTIVNEGYSDLDKPNNLTHYTYWADREEIKEAYGLTGKLWMVRGEFMLFRKGEAVSNLFKTAREIMKSPKVDLLKLGGGVTDEFALNIALNLNGMEPHKEKWMPAYWPLMHGGNKPIYQMNGYFAISFGGNNIPRNSEKTYETLVKAAAYKTGVPYRFPLRAKRTFLAERLKN